MSGSGEPTVLVVEDERHLADLYAGWLAERYPVRVAYDGEQAIEEIDDSVDVVLLDRRMPGVSGDEVLRTVTDREYPCRVAMVTAIEPDFDVIGMGFDDYLVKPVGYEELQSTVDRLVTRSNYDEQVDEYARLLSKKVALETEKSRRQLERCKEFARLESKIERLGSTVDDTVQRFDQEDIAALLRDLPAEGRT